MIRTLFGMVARNAQLKRTSALFGFDAIPMSKSGNLRVTDGKH